MCVVAFNMVADITGRALYSIIQFTTITLLYSFASSLGDFQVRRLSDCASSIALISLLVPLHRPVYYHSHCGHQSVNLLSLPISQTHVLNRSGPDPPVYQYPSQAADCLPRLQKGPLEYHWPDYPHQRVSVLGFLLGSRPDMASSLIHA